MTHASLQHKDVLAACRKHRLLVVTPVVVATLAALGYALLRPKVWEASQALVVRDEASDGAPPGRFENSDEMKNSQETILELARSRGVLLAALREVGPPAGEPVSNWPGQRALETLQDRVKITPPKGAEFGKTEVFYLKVDDENPDRAIALATAVCEQLQDRLAALREATAKSTIAELTRSAGMARDDLDATTGKLAELEQGVGNDLAELRILTESPAGDSDLRRNLVDLERELRVFQARQAEDEASLKLLSEAQHDPEKLLAAPAALLRAQPALGRLKDGLVDAQLRSGEALGTMHETHPRVQGAREAERVIREQLHDEIGLAIKGIEADLRVDARHTADLERQIDAARGRLSRLAGVRAEYANLTAAVRQRNDMLTRVEHELAEARASQVAARTASRISPIDKPDVGTRPVGPGRTMIVAAGFGGGLMIAAGLLFLLITPTHLPAKASSESDATRQPPDAAGPTTIVADFSLPADLLPIGGSRFNGHAVGPANGHTNGHANGQANGHTNGHGTENSHAPAAAAPAPRPVRKAKHPRSTKPLTLKQAVARVADQPL